MKNNSVFVTNSFLLETLAPEARKLAKDYGPLQSVESLSQKVNALGLDIKSIARALGRPDIAASIPAIAPRTGNVIKPISPTARRIPVSENLDLKEISRLLGIVDTADALKEGSAGRAVKAAGGNIMDAEYVAGAAVVASLSKVLPGHKIHGGGQ